MTKSYVESKLFGKHLNETNEMNKNILMLKLEDFDTILPKSYKIFDMSITVRNHSSFSFFSTYIEYRSDSRLQFSDTEVECHEYMFDLKDSLKVKLVLTCLLDFIHFSSF